MRATPTTGLLYMNCGALATELTNEQCDFWHFRFTANVDQRAVARIKTLPESVKSVYVLNQDYLFGQSVEKATLKYLAQYRPDIKVVADELVPFGKVQDFSPYIAKIKASGAQSLVTSNYDRDLNLLMKAGNDAGLDIRYDVVSRASAWWPDIDRPRRRQSADLDHGIPRQRAGRGT